jgi:predicted ATPase
LYDRVPAGRRVELHRRVAERQEVGWADRAAEIAAELAHHFNRANDKAKALKYFQLAGGQAVRRSANHEAIAYFTTALRILEELPRTSDASERAQKELELRIGLGTPLISIKGFGSPEVEGVYTRARELCRQVGEPPQLFPVLWALWVIYTGQAKHLAARELADQCLHLAERAQVPALVMAAHHALGVTLSTLGEFVPALAHLEEVIALYDPAQHAPLAFQFGQDFGVVARSHAAIDLWYLGFPDQALKRNIEALSLAQKLSHPFSLAAASAFAAWIHQMRRDRAATQDQAEEALKVSNSREFAFWRGIGIVLQGWAVSDGAQTSDGIARMCEVVTAYRSAGGPVMFPSFLALLADAYGTAGQFEAGLNALTEAQAAAERSGERWWEPELYRLEGELLLKQSGVRNPKPKDQKRAAECFLRAIEIARGQNARSLELRAAISLNRLWRAPAQRAEARRLLKDTYDWFTEGLNSPDSEEARILLAEH